MLASKLNLYEEYFTRTSYFYVGFQANPAQGMDGHCRSFEDKKIFSDSMYMFDDALYED